MGKNKAFHVCGLQSADQRLWERMTSTQIQLHPRRKDNAGPPWVRLRFKTWERQWQHHRTQIPDVLKELLVTSNQTLTNYRMFVSPNTVSHSWGQNYQHYISLYTNYTTKMSQKADLNPPVFQFLLCLFGCAKAVDEHSAIDVIDQKAPAKGGSLFQIIRGKELLIRSSRISSKWPFAQCLKSILKKLKKLEANSTKVDHLRMERSGPQLLGENFFNS